MSDNQSIKETLSVIRKALEDEEYPKNDNLDDNILILNKLITEDGKINLINNSFISKEEILHSFDTKLDDIFEKNLIKWFDRNLPKYLEKYFKNKNS